METFKHFMLFSKNPHSIKNSYRTVLFQYVIILYLPECRDTSGTFTPFLARTFESSLAKVHKITKKVGQNRSAPLGSFNFTGKRLSLLVSVHMAFVEGMLIKQMRLFLGV